MYLAEEDGGARVVLKVLTAPQRNQGLFDPKIADEASAYARLSHPNIVKVVDLFSTEGRFVVALEFIEGASLAVVLGAMKRAGVPLDDGVAVYVGVSMFAAIAAAHDARDDAGRPAPVLHRNVNPANVLVGWDGTVKLGNFNVGDVANVLRESNPGFTWGSYGYFAPERVQQLEVGTAADVYSASLVLWELLAGRKAIDTSTLTDAQILAAMAQPIVPSLDVVRPHLDPRVRNALRTGLQPDPANRTITAAQMRDVLAQTVHGATQRKRLRGQLEQARPQAASVRSSRVPAVVSAPVSADLVSVPPSLPPTSAMIVSSSELIPSNAPVAVVPPPLPAPIPAPPPLPHGVVAPLEQEPPTHEVGAPPASTGAGRRTAAAVIAGGVIVFAAAAVAMVLLRPMPGDSSSPPGLVPSVSAQASTAPVPAPPPATAPSPAQSVAAPAPPPPTAPTETASQAIPPPAPAPSSAASDVPADQGRLVFPPSAAGHRVFVDGRVVGDGGQPATVACGPHTVRIGSAGTVQHVTVPCGGTLTMSLR